MSNKLSYFHRLSKGSINYGPLELKVTTEKQRETSIEVFEFCHEQNSSSTEFSMTNEVSVSGVLKAFNIGASHSNTFATTSTKATQEGKEIKTYEREFVSEKVELTRTVKEDQFLAHYVLVDLYCFTVNGGERRYAHVPRSDVLIEPLDEEEMGKLSNGTFLMEKASWEVVTSRYPDIQLDDIPTYARQLTPLKIIQPIPLGVNVALKSAHGTYIRAHPGGEGSKLDMQTRIGSWEQCVIQEVPGQTNVYTIRSRHGTYFRAHPGGEGSKLDLQTRIGSWEKFFIEEVPGQPQVFTFRSCHGTYIRAHSGGEGSKVDLQTKIGSWEKFRLSKI